MDFSSIDNLVLHAVDFVWGWPLVIFIMAMGIIMTIALGFVQFRYFVTAWKLALFPQKETSSSNADMTPFQAFVNALSASLGNGSIGGMATAVYSGGPGAALWIFIFGLLSMSIRYSEVFLSTYFKDGRTVLGGPMIYLSKVPGGSFLPWTYALFCLLLGIVSGNAAQANSMTLSLNRSFGISPLVIAGILLAFVVYVIIGGADRIVFISDRIVPLKVGLFFATMFVVLGYHYQAIIPALQLIVSSAFSTSAVAGGALGYGMQHAMRFGISRISNASEAGLGTAGILFGGSGGKNPVNDSIMSMLATFISANLVCFSIALMIVASGVWNSGLTSTPLTSAAFETVLGVWGSYITTFLSVAFGLGVIVTYAYINRECWLFLTKGQGIGIFNIIFGVITFAGALAKVDVIWNAVDLINAGLLTMNLFAILWLLPVIRKGLKDFERKA